MAPSLERLHADANDEPEDGRLEMTHRFRSGRPTYKWLASLAAAAALMVMGASGIGAQSASEDGRHVKASLVAVTQNIVAGQPLRLALRQEIAAGWHTYWSNPGESGQPTTIE